VVLAQAGRSRVGQVAVTATAGGRQPQATKFAARGSLRGSHALWRTSKRGEGRASTCICASECKDVDAFHGCT